MKTCIICDIPKTLDNFHTDRRLKDGVKGKCKECYRLYLSIPAYKERRRRQSSEAIKRAKENLTDSYIIRQICHHNSLTPNDVRKYPELIKATKLVMITNRIIKDEKNKNNKGFKG